MRLRFLPALAANLLSNTSAPARRTLYVAAFLLAWLGAPAQAAVNLGSLGIPGLGGPPMVLDPLNPIDPTPEIPPIPPAPEPLIIGSVGNDFLRVVTHTGAGTHALYRQEDGGSFQLLRSVPPQTRTETLEEDLRVGTRYCYRLDSTSAGQTRQRFRCATTDWRVGFKGRVISADETRRVLDLFDWHDTRVLPKGEELPALYYMNVLVDDVNMPQGLRDIGIHVEPNPVFGVELDGWKASSTLVRDGEQVIGRWHYAVVPGHFYNQIRELTLARLADGEEAPFRAIVFRQLPDYEARDLPLDRHRLSYRYLGERGFEYNGTVNDGCVYSEEFGGKICPNAFGWVLRKVGAWIWEAAESMVEGVRAGLGQFQLLYKDDANVDLTFQLLNTDPAFGLDEPMVSGWSGEELRLRDMRVHVRQGVAAFYGRTDGVGRFRKRVLRGVTTKVCIETENDVVELTEFLTEETVCLPSLGKLTGDLTDTLPVRHDYLNTLAGMTDAHDYLLEVAGFNMPKITVMVGGVADRVAVEDRSFAPCMGRVPSLLGVLGDAAGLLLPGLGTLAAAGTEFVTAVDIVLRSDDDGSRGVPVHEYGHTVMCSLLQTQGILAFEQAWTDVILATADQSPGNDVSYINEAFADFLTAQVAGGTNYFVPGAGALVTEGASYCNAGSECVEKDFNSEGTFRQQVARITSLLHDAFDGTDAYDGSYWQHSGGAVQGRVGAADSVDASGERIALARTDLRRLFDYWDARGSYLTEDNFLGGLADLLAARGYPEGEICDLFRAHSAANTCPGYVSNTPWLAWASGAATAGSTLFTDQPLQPTAIQAGALAVPPSWLEASAKADAEADAPEWLLVDTQGKAVPMDAQMLKRLPKEERTLLSELTAEPTDAAAAELPEYPVALALGTQKVKVAGLGKVTRESGFAFRIADGWWEGMDPLGQQLAGGWSLRGGDGAVLRLHLAPEFEGALARLVADSFDAGIDEQAIDFPSPPRIQVKVRNNGSVAAKVVIPFEVEVEGELRSGKYVAKLRGEAL